MSKRLMLSAIFGLLFCGCNEKKPLSKERVSLGLEDSLRKGQHLSIIGNDSYDFGKVDMGKVVEASFQVRNFSGTPVMPEILKSCGCTDVKLLPQTISPGQTAKVRAKVDTLYRPGRFLGYIALRSNGMEEVRYRITGDVVASATLICNPSLVDIGNLRIGEKKEFKLTVQVITETPGDGWEVTTAFSDNNPLPVKLGIDGLKLVSKIEQRHPRAISVYEGNAEIIAVHAGNVDDGAINVVASRDNGGKKTAGVIRLAGRVVGNIWARQEQVFLGVADITENRKFHIDIVTDTEGYNPDVKLPDNALQMTGRSPLTDAPGWRYEFIFNPAEEGFYRGKISFVDEDDEVIVKVIAKVVGEIK